MTRHLKSPTLKSLTVGAALILMAGTALAEGPFDAPITARQSQMRLLAFNIGQLGGMAKGVIPYDADKAAAAAANLQAVANLNGGAFWPKGSDSFSFDNTNALPKIWDNMSDVGKKFQDLQTATTAMDAAAGGGLDAVKVALGPLGEACKACHKEYRKPKDK